MFFSRSPHEFTEGSIAGRRGGCRRQRRTTATGEAFTQRAHRSRQAEEGIGQRGRKRSENRYRHGLAQGIACCAHRRKEPCAASGNVSRETSHIATSNVPSKGHLVSRPDCVTGNNPRRASNASRETIRAERRARRAGEPPHQSETAPSSRIRISGTVSRNREHALRRAAGRAAELAGSRAYCWDRNDVSSVPHGIASRKDADRSHQRVDPGHEREDGPQPERARPAGA